MSFDLEQALDSGSVTGAVREFLGIQEEQYICPECNAVCDETRVYDPNRHAFDEGKSPAWECPECERTFVRESKEEQYAVDLYGRE